jgi:hypothetical protein
VRQRRHEQSTMRNRVQGPNAKNAAAGNPRQRFLIENIVEEFVPSLAGLAATYSSKP